MLWDRKAMTLCLLGIIAYSVLVTLLIHTFRYTTRVKPYAKPDMPTSHSFATPAPPLTLITLFTTFNDNAAKTVTHRNTIRNWGLLAPFVRPVLYYMDGEDYLNEFARMHGWAVYRCPNVSEIHVPVLRSMFLHAQAINQTTPFYGYANSDILFDRKLLITLEALKREGDRFKWILVIGQRTNYNFARDQQLFDLLSVSRLASTGKLLPGFAQDYFITTHFGYPWDSIPDFVVGRVGYDNWLVATALKRNISVIDVTATVTALHQTGSDGNAAGRNVMRKLEDVYFNHRLAGNFDYSRGITMCSNFITRVLGPHIVILKQPIGCIKAPVLLKRKTAPDF